MTTPATKQSETRERGARPDRALGVGDAIPSERQLSADLGVSRLTVRAALDDLVREGYLVRRRGSGTFVSEPKIAQELTMTSFSEDMRAPRMKPASRTLELDVVQAGARLGRFLHVSPSERIVVAKRLRLADGETMAIETLHVREIARPRPHGRPRARVVLRAARGALRRRDRRRHPDDRADRDERGGVGGARRAAPLARRSCSSASPATRAARSSSSSARSTAATATGSSPS